MAIRRSRVGSVTTRLRPVRRAAVVGALACFLTLLVPASTAAPGDTDPSFGSNGVVRTDFGGSDDRVNAVALQPDGKIVAAGTTGTAIALARYNPDGSLDTSFGSGGKVTTTIGPRDAGNAVLLQPDGKIVVAGGTVLPISIETQGFALARYNTDGSLDTSFGSGGVITTRIDYLSLANAAVLQPDGKIVAAGLSLPNINIRPPTAFALARYEPDGSLDTSFGSGGTVETGCGGANADALQPDGKIVVAGTCEFYPAVIMELVRFKPNGSLDTSFGSNGTVENPNGVARALAVQPDGKIVVGGSFDKSVGETGGPVVRYDPDGSLDRSFGSGGMVTQPTGFGAAAVAVQPDGKIVAAGTSDDGSFELARYNPNGSLDTSFGSRGRVRKPVGTAAALVLQPDGKIVAGGSSRGRSDLDFTLVRYLGSGSPRCVVPKVVGLALARARDRIISAHCRTGKISRRYSARPKARVLAQSPKAGTQLAAGAAVRLVVSRGPKPRIARAARLLDTRTGRV